MNITAQKHLFNYIPTYNQKIQITNPDLRVGSNYSNTDGQGKTIQCKGIIRSNNSLEAEFECLKCKHDRKIVGENEPQLIISLTIL